MARHILPQANKEHSEDLALWEAVSSFWKIKTNILFTKYNNTSEKNVLGEMHNPINLSRTKVKIYTSMLLNLQSPASVHISIQFCSFVFNCLQVV
jgi:hypothetical protein